MWYLAIFMASHLKQQERSNGVWGPAGGGGGGGHKHFCHISGGGGVEKFFPKGLGGSSNVLPTT